MDKQITSTYYICFFLVIPLHLEQPYPWHHGWQSRTPGAGAAEAQCQPWGSAHSASVAARPSRTLDNSPSLVRPLCLLVILVQQSKSRSLNVTEEDRYTPNWRSTLCNILNYPLTYWYSDLNQSSLKYGPQVHLIWPIRLQ